MYATLLWATDGSASADLALAEAKRLLQPGGRIMALHCEPRTTGVRVGGRPGLTDQAERTAKIRTQVEELNADGIETELLIETTRRATPRAIVRTADEFQVEAIVCGTRGFGGLHRASAGSVSAELIHYSHVPVIVVPAAPGHVSEPAPEVRSVLVG
jgi:nucleotide-binding universal stress UspA family protein